MSNKSKQRLSVYIFQTMTVCQTPSQRRTLKTNSWIYPDLDCMHVTHSGTIIGWYCIPVNWYATMSLAMIQDEIIICQNLHIMRVEKCISPFKFNNVYEILCINNTRKCMGYLPSVISKISTSILEFMIFNINTFLVSDV